jgi:glycosyltransferase involved in cell wall biosynthesis
MKVLFLIKSVKTPSSRIRVSDLEDTLRRSGVEPDIVPIPDGLFARMRLFARAADYPVTVLQKRLLSLVEFFELRRRAKVLVFDFDDAVYHKNASPSENPRDYTSATRMRKFSRTVLNCDLVIAANAVLAERAAEIAPGVPRRIIPSSVRVEDLVPKSSYEPVSPGSLRIGWVGTKSTLRYLDIIAPALRKIQPGLNAVLRVVSDVPAELPDVRAEFVRWTVDGQYEEIKNFDIGVMPLSPDPFSEGKAAYKLLQYMALGVPSVCSPVGMSKEVSGRGEFCLTAVSPGEFASKITRLASDIEFRRGLGERARKLVLEKYSSGVVGAELARILKAAAGDL